MTTRFIAMTGWGVALLAPLIATAQQPCLKDAWAAFNKKDYAAALDAADDCIGQFARRALRDQADLRRGATPVPKPGPKTDSEKSVIFARGVLNDTGAAYFIKGRSAEFLAKGRPRTNYLSMAREAYERCTELSHALTWDPQGWFWSTSEACSDRLDAIGREAPTGASKQTSPARRPPR
jgi:hypothetical protein